MSERATVHLVRDGFPNPETLDTTVSHALLRRVSDGSEPETIRLHRPGAVVAFGPVDRHSPGFAAAVAEARSRGFGCVLRLAGGRAAVFHEETIAFSWVRPDPSPRVGIRERFEELASIVAAAFGDLGVDARVGEVSGEYCPGEFSVSAGGRTKLMGVGQRLVLRAAHVGGVIVVDGGPRIRDVLVPVYRALELDWDPSTVGSLRDEVPSITWDATVEALTERFAERVDLVDDAVSNETLALARTLESRHAVTIGPS